MYCFSYAGGSAAAYVPWQNALPGVEICAVQLPGRGARFKETPYTSMPSLIRDLAGVIERQDDSLPHVFFGHSLGALVAFELVRHCRANGMRMPRKLIVSGANPPRWRNSLRMLHLLDDDGLIEELKGYNGTPMEILEDRELMALLLPTIRADFKIAETYQYTEATPLNMPITVFQGTSDDYICKEKIADWRLETTNTCNVHWFDGDHFFIDAKRDEVLATIKAELAQETFAPSY